MDRRLDPEAIKAALRHSKRDEVAIEPVILGIFGVLALDIVKAIAEAPEPYGDHTHLDEKLCRDIYCATYQAHRWWKAARALVRGDAHE